MRAYRVLLGLGTAAALAAGCGNQSVCEQHGSVNVCGEFGAPVYDIHLGNVSVEWPPVAVANGKILVSRGKELVEIGADGKVTPVQQTGEQLTVPSADEAGGLYLLGGNGGASTLRAFDDSQAKGQARWTKELAGQPVGTPASVGQGVVHAATVKGGKPTLYTIDRKDGTVVQQRDGASPAAVLADGSLRYLSGPKGATGPEGAQVFGALSAEDGQGKTLWTWNEPDGLVDFAPGPAGETYVVTANSHVLRKVSAEGKAAWSFTPPCANCTVAAAPTVADDVVYFPVWETRREELIDPLYAISAQTGAVLWVYDGFFTKETGFGAHSLFGGAGEQPADVQRTQHHPAGRPVVAQDGTLYVSTDGAVTALDKNGQMLGVAIYDEAAGEVSDGDDSFSSRFATWINPGVRPSPVLGPDGTLYVWDGGAGVRAFRTGKAAKTGGWIAPFGGPSNDGRLPQ